MIDTSTTRRARPSRHGGRVVCHLIASNFAGGPEKQIVELCSRLPSIGWRGIVGSFRENRPAVDVIEAAQRRGIETFMIDTRSPFNPAAIRQLARRLRRHQVDALVTHGYKSNLIGRLATRRTGTPHAATARGYTAEDWRVRTYEAVDRWLLKRIERVFCVSDATRRYVTALGVSGDRTVLVPNAVDVVDVEPLDLRKQLGFAADAIVIVAAGRLSAEKGHRHLVEAMEILADRAPDARLAILGEGPERGALERQIARASLEDRVVLAGFRKDVPRCLAGADLIVNPSLSEGLPNVVLEALAAQRPVVATAVGGVDELITPGETGVLVPPGDVPAMAAAIAGAIADRERADRWASNGRRRVVECYSFELQLERFTAACERLIQHHARTEPVS